MTNAVAAGSISARAPRGRRTSLRCAAVAVLSALVAPVVVLLPATQAAAADIGCTSGAIAGFTVDSVSLDVPAGNASFFPTGGPRPPDEGTGVSEWVFFYSPYGGTLHITDPCEITNAWGAAVSPETGTVYGAVATAGAQVWRARKTATTSTYPDWPAEMAPAPVPQPCDDGDLENDLNSWGGYGGGGAWGASDEDGKSLWEYIAEPLAEARNPLLLWRNLQAENEEQIEWFKVQWNATLERWVLYDLDTGTEVPRDTAGFGGYGGGGQWGVGCEADPEAAPADPPPPVVVVSEPPPEQVAPTVVPSAPSGGCDFGITDPSSWLCGLAGVLGRVLDAIRWIVGWLGRLGGFLLDLFVPDADVLQGKFADVDTAWDASGPGQLTGGLTDIAAPVLAMDENMPTTCAGPEFTLPLPDARSFSMNPLSTCGELTQYILGVVYPLETALIYLGGFFLGLRIVTRPFGMETPGTTQAAAA